MIFARVATKATWALVLAGTASTSLFSQRPARAIYYSVPSWAPDGRTIAFESNRDGEAAVYTIRPDGSRLRRLTPSGALGEQPNWSTDGRFLVYTSTRDSVRQLHRMTPDGREVVTLPGTTNGFLAAYSPDGRWLLFAAQDRRPSNQYRVFVMRPDGSDRRSLGDMTKSNEDPRWTMDGAQVVFTEVRAAAVTGVREMHAFTVEYIKAGITEFREETTDFYGNAELVVDAGTYGVTYGPEHVTERGKYLNVWKQENGNWKIQSNIWNSDAPARSDGEHEVHF